MAKLKYKKIASLDQFPRGDRCSMTINLMKGSMAISIHGREAKDEEISGALWRYHEALNSAEAQIDMLLKIIRSEDPYDELHAYQKAFEEDGDEDIRYKLDEYRSALFNAMHKKDGHKISYYLNLISVIEEKREKQNASHEAV